MTAIFSTLITTHTSYTFAKTSEHEVLFSQGTNIQNLQGSFKGYDNIQYTITAKEGQILKFDLTSTHDLAYINIFTPGDKPGEANALLIGSIVGSKGELKLPVSGQYILQVYQMRNTARKNKTVNFKLKLQILNPLKE